MPKNQSRRKDRNKNILRAWTELNENIFTSFGISRADIEAAQAQLSGKIILPQDPTYSHDRKIANPVFNPQPVMIVQCETEHDVQVALGLARKGRQPFTVRSGGHCTAGFCASNGVLIDVKGLDHVHVDKAAQTAVVGAGTDFHRFNQALEMYGLHVPGGECEDVCVGGYVQGGGIGFTSATYGMNCDNVLAVRVMLADGSIVIADENQNRDLWWAVRGGTGGNFGILLSITYQLHALADVWGYAYAWPIDTFEGLAQAVDVCMMLQAGYLSSDAAKCDETLQVLVVYQTILDPAKPPLDKMTPLFMVRGLSVTDPSEPDNIRQQIAAMPGAVCQFQVTGSYNDVLAELLDSPQSQPIGKPNGGPMNEDKSSRYVQRDLSRGEWASMLELFVNDSPNDMTYAYLEFYKGAIASYPVENSAFIHRAARFDTVLDVFWYSPGDQAANEAFMYKWNKLIETFWNGHVYQNYPSITVPNYALNYWGSAVKGLVATKQKYDPEGAFTFSQQIPTTVPDWAQDQSIPDAVAAALEAEIDLHSGVAAVG